MTIKPTRSPDAAGSVGATKSYCRFCHAYCPIEVEVEDGRVTRVRGDAADPIYHGYTCIKGRQLPDFLNHPDRIRRPQKRDAQGGFAPIASQRALDEIADKLRDIIARHGPVSVASYCGTHAFQNSAALAVSRAFHQGLGSPSFYSSVTIDQPAKYIAPSRVGFWAGGNHGFESADVVMIIGNNTVVSQYSPFGGIPAFSPHEHLQAAQRRGLQVICIDPRRTEVARKAQLHLQVKPGEDPTLLAGMARVILAEGLHDAAFCDRWVEGIDELREALVEFTPEYVEQRSGVPAHQMVEAARLFARGPRGSATTGTGPDMAPRPNLTEHMVIVLNVLCGRFNREGERLPNPGVLSRPSTRRAQAIPPTPVWGKGPQLRVRGLGQVFGEMPCAALADEILLPGEGQVRALLCIGGNPIVAWPDQAKVVRAIDDLELFATVDVKMSASARRADYVIAPQVSLEREDVTLLTDAWYEKPYSHYTRAVVDPDPETMDVMEEWEFYWELARRLGSPITLPGGELDLDEKPTKFEVLEKILPQTRVPLSEIRARRGGSVFEQIEVRVAAAKPDAEGRLQLAPDGICDELREVRGEPLSDDAGYAADTQPFSHRLISRRLKHVYNSSGQELPKLAAKGKTNLAYMNPADIAALGLASGDLVEIASASGAILGVAEATDEVLPGVVSMAHAWGGTPERDGEVREIGSSTNRLVDDTRDYDPISGMARQSAIPVNVRPVTEAARPA